MILLEGTDSIGLTSASPHKLVKRSYQFSEAEMVNWKLVSQDKVLSRAETGVILLCFATKPRGIVERRGTLAEIVKKRYHINGQLVEEEMSSQGNDITKVGVLQIDIQEFQSALKLLYQMYNCSSAVICKEADKEWAAHWLLKNNIYCCGYTIDAVAQNSCEILKRDIALLYTLRGCDGCSFNFIYLMHDD